MRDEEDKHLGNAVEEPFADLAAAVRSLAEEFRAARKAVEDERRDFTSGPSIEALVSTQREQRGQIEEMSSALRGHLEAVERIKTAYAEEVAKLRREIAGLSSKFDVEAAIRRAIRLGEQPGYFPNALSFRSETSTGGETFKVSVQGAFGSVETEGESVVGTVLLLLQEAEKAALAKRKLLDEQFPAKTSGAAQ